jgi:hypothetical protein
MYNINNDSKGEGFPVHALKPYRWNTGIAPLINLVPGGGEWSAARSGCLTSGEETSGKHWVGGCAGLDVWRKGTSLTLIQWRIQECVSGGGFNKFSWGQRAERTRIWGRQPPSQGFHAIYKRVKPVFWLGCYGCIFHGTGNLVQLCQNFGIWGGGGVFETPQFPSR